MIHVNRHNIEKPKFFNSKEFEVKNEELKAFYYFTSQSKRAQKRFVNYELPYEVTESLLHLFKSKCAYCESKIELSRFSSVDHFRPRNNARGFENQKGTSGFGDGQTDLEHYWWFSYEWNNLYLCCTECLKYKSNWFPVEGKRVEFLTSYEETVKKENNLILDPCNEVDIEKHLYYEFDTGKVVPLSEKGEVTIEILQLNRKRLESSRRKALEEEYGNWESILNEYRKTKQLRQNRILEHWKGILNATSDVEFIGIRKSMLLDRLSENPDIWIEFERVLSQENLSKDNNQSSIFDSISFEEEKYIKEVDFKAEKGITRKDELVEKAIDTKNDVVEIKELLKNVYLDRIELKNYKCFDSLTIDLTSNTISEKEPWLVFLGENGVGKSSLIKAVALALMGQKYLDVLNLDASKILKYGKRSGYVKVYGSKSDEFYEVTFNNNSKSLKSNIVNPPCYLLGYGSTRLLPKGNLVPESNANYIKAKNLFDYSVSLSDAKEWLLEIPTKMFNQVALSLKDLLLLESDDIIKRHKQKNTLYIDYADAKNRIDIEELSDGYKSIFAVTVDIIKTLSRSNIAFERAEAVVLIDEIGTHLHPRWKMEVVSRLRKTFPKIQFIVTTHEPLCLRGLEKNEVLVLKRNEAGKIISINNLPNPSDFRVDQLLTSEYFGLNSTLDFETERLFNEYYNLLAKDERSEEEQNRVSELNQILPSKKHIGDDIRDELVYFVIDELLAKQVKNEGFKIIDETIKKEALDRVKSIWAFMSENDDK